MAAIPAEQLDAATRARLGLGGSAGRTKPKPSTAGSSGWNLACCACGHQPASQAAAARHTADSGHHTWELPLEAS
jgi:hypothetical protein